MQKLAAMLSDSDFIASVPCEKATYPADSIILDEGSEGRDLFVLMRGEAQVSYSLDEAYDQPARLTRLTVNDIFGELSVFDNQPRSAEVKALTECDVYKIAGPELLAYLDAHPDQG
ncbi:MAG: cyclic nucleotide-binding domain-containing protein, partial [Methylomonas sp.]